MFRWNTQALEDHQCSSEKLVATAHQREQPNSSKITQGFEFPLERFESGARASGLKWLFDLYCRERIVRPLHRDSGGWSRQVRGAFLEGTFLWVPADPVRAHSDLSHLRERVCQCASVRCKRL